MTNIFLDTNIIIYLWELDKTKPHLPKGFSKKTLVKIRKDFLNKNDFCFVIVGRDMKKEILCVNKQWMPISLLEFLQYKNMIDPENGIEIFNICDDFPEYSNAVDQDVKNFILNEFNFDSKGYIEDVKKSLKLHPIQYNNEIINHTNYKKYIFNEFNHNKWPKIVGDPHIILISRQFQVKKLYTNDYALDKQIKNNKEKYNIQFLELFGCSYFYN